MMANEQCFVLKKIQADNNAIPCSRADRVYGLISEAFYSSNRKPNIHNERDLIEKVARLLVQNPQDTYPIQILYTYFVGAGTDKMEPLLQQLGHHLVRQYGVPFDLAEQLLNYVVRRLAAVGRMREMERSRGTRRDFQSGHSSLNVPMRNVTPAHMMQGQWSE